MQRADGPKYPVPDDAFWPLELRNSENFNQRLVAEDTNADIVSRHLVLKRRLEMCQSATPPKQKSRRFSVDLRPCVDS